MQDLVIGGGYPIEQLLPCGCFLATAVKSANWGPSCSSSAQLLL
jgi:hypothetical protein